MMADDGRLWRTMAARDGPLFMKAMAAINPYQPSRELKSPVNWTTGSGDGLSVWLTVWATALAVGCTAFISLVGVYLWTEAIYPNELSAVALIGWLVAPPIMMLILMIGRTVQANRRVVRCRQVSSLVECGHDPPQ